MNTKSSILALATLFAATAFTSAAAAAPETDYVSLGELSEMTGIAPPSLRLLFGARSPHPNYDVKFKRVTRDWQDAVARLAAEGIVLDLQDDGRIAVRRNPGLIASTR
jgi:hypothetical protein